MLHRVLKLSYRDRRLLAHAGLLVLGVRIGLWVLPYQVLRHRLRVEPKATTEPHPWPRIVWAVTAVSRYVPKASCLTQALAAEALLCRNGYPAAVHIGVAKTVSATLEAHAWVEYQGKIVLGGGGMDRFTPLQPFLK